MEAMRLSMIDHEEHQRKMADEDKNKANGKQAAVGDAAAAGNAPSTAGTSQPGPSQGATPTSSRRSSAAAATQGSWPAAQASSDSNGRGQGAASKLLSKITVGNRSRANSKSSVHFAPSPATVGSSPSGSNPGSNPPTLAATAANSADSVQTLSRNCSSSTPSPNPVQQAAHTHSPLAQDSSSHAANGFSTTAAVALPATTVTGPTDVEAPLIDLTPPARNAPLPKEPTAANPYPELAALMAEAVGDDSQPAASASASASATLAPSAASSAKTTSAPLAIPSQNASTSDLISVSSLASTPPGVHDPRPEVPLSAMADDDDY
jgi:hypothetical protein